MKKPANRPAGRQAAPQPIADDEDAGIVFTDEHPDITDAQLATARPFAEAFPELAATFKRGRGRPKVENPKEQISIRLSAEVLDAFRATGDGWRGRIEEVLASSVRSGHFKTGGRSGTTRRFMDVRPASGRFTARSDDDASPARKIVERDPGSGRLTEPLPRPAGASDKKRKPQG